MQPLLKAGPNAACAGVWPGWGSLEQPPTTGHPGAERPPASSKPLLKKKMFFSCWLSVAGWRFDLP